MKSLLTVTHDSSRSRRRWLSWATWGLFLALLGLCYYWYFSWYYFLPRAVPVTWRAQLGEVGSVQLIEQVKKIYLHYHWKDVGSRVGREEIVTSGGQQCDGAVTVLKEMFASGLVEQLDLAVVDDDGVTHGHSIARITHQGRVIYADPSWGIVWFGLRGRDLHIDLTALEGLSRVGMPTPFFDRKLGRFPANIYDNLRRGQFQASLPDQTLGLLFPKITFRNHRLIGKSDGSADDIALLYGTYQSGLGSEKRLVQQVFPFESPGEACLFEFRLTKAEFDPLQLDIAGPSIAPDKMISIPNEAASVFVFLLKAGASGSFTLAPHNKLLGRRGIDSISACVVTGKNPQVKMVTSVELPESIRMIAGDGNVEIRGEPVGRGLPLCFKTCYWNRCLVEFVPTNQAQDYYLLHGSAGRWRKVRMEVSGLSRYAVVYEPTTMGSDTGLVGIVDAAGVWVNVSDIKVARLSPAESGNSFFSL